MRLLALRTWCHNGDTVGLAAFEIEAPGQRHRQAPATRPTIAGRVISCNGYYPLQATQLPSTHYTGHGVTTFSCTAQCDQVRLSYKSRRRAHPVTRDGTPLLSSGRKPKWVRESTEGFGGEAYGEGGAAAERTYYRATPPARGGIRALIAGRRGCIAVRDRIPSPEG